MVELISIATLQIGDVRSQKLKLLVLSSILTLYWWCSWTKFLLCWSLVAFRFIEFWGQLALLSSFVVMITLFSFLIVVDICNWFCWISLILLSTKIICVKHVFFLSQWFILWVISLFKYIWSKFVLLLSVCIDTTFIGCIFHVTLGAPSSCIWH